MTIAIARFTNESTYGAGLFTDESGDRLGKQASDLLANHLVETRRFVVVERTDLGRLKAEAKLMGLSEEAFRKHLTGVDALILGSVAELGRETTGKSWFPVTASTRGQKFLTASMTRKASGGSPKWVRSPVRIA